MNPDLVLCPSSNWYRSHLTTVLPGGHRLAYAAHCSVLIACLPDGEEVQLLSGHPSRVTALAVSRLEESRHLLGAGCEDGTLKIWDYDKPGVVKTVRTHRQAITAMVALTSPEVFWVYTDISGRLLSWPQGRANKPSALTRITSTMKEQGTFGSCLAASPSCTGQVAVGCDSGVVLVVDVLSDRVLGRVSAHTGRMYSLKWTSEVQEAEVKGVQEVGPSSVEDVTLKIKEEDEVEEGEIQEVEGEVAEEEGEIKEAPGVVKEECQVEEEEEGEVKEVPGDVCTQLGSSIVSEAGSDTSGREGTAAQELLKSSTTSGPAQVPSHVHQSAHDRQPVHYLPAPSASQSEGSEGLASKGIHRVDLALSEEQQARVSLAPIRAPPSSEGPPLSASFPSPRDEISATGTSPGSSPSDSRGSPSQNFCQPSSTIGTEKPSGQHWLLTSGEDGMVKVWDWNMWEAASAPGAGHGLASDVAAIRPLCYVHLPRGTGPKGKNQGTGSPPRWFPATFLPNGVNCKGSFLVAVGALGGSVLVYRLTPGLSHHPASYLIKGLHSRIIFTLDAVTMPPQHFEQDTNVPVGPEDTHSGRAKVLTLTTSQDRHLVMAEVDISMVLNSQPSPLGHTSSKAPPNQNSGSAQSGASPCLPVKILYKQQGLGGHIYSLAIQNDPRDKDSPSNCTLALSCGEKTLHVLPWTSEHLKRLQEKDSGNQKVRDGQHKLLSQSIPFDQHLPRDQSAKSLGASGRVENGKEQGHLGGPGDQQAPRDGHTSDEAAAKSQAPKCGKRDTKQRRKDVQKRPGLLTIWQGVPGKVLSMSWHPTNNRLVAIGCDDGSVGVCDIRSQQCSLYQRRHPAPVVQVGWGPKSWEGVRLLKSPTTTRGDQPTRKEGPHPKQLSEGNKRDLSPVEGSCGSTSEEPDKAQGAGATFKTHQQGDPVPVGQQEQQGTRGPPEAKGGARRGNASQERSRIRSKDPRDHDSSGTQQLHSSFLLYSCGGEGRLLSWRSPVTDEFTEGKVHPRGGGGSVAINQAALQSAPQDLGKEFEDLSHFWKAEVSGPGSDGSDPVPMLWSCFAWVNDWRGLAVGTVKGDVMVFDRVRVSSRCPGWQLMGWWTPGRDTGMTRLKWGELLGGADGNDGSQQLTLCAATTTSVTVICAPEVEERQPKPAPCQSEGSSQNCLASSTEKSPAGRKLPVLGGIGDLRISPKNPKVKVGDMCWCGVGLLAVGLSSGEICLYEVCIKSLATSTRPSPTLTALPLHIFRATSEGVAALNVVQELKSLGDGTKAEEVQDDGEDTVHMMAASEDLAIWCWTVTHTDVQKLRKQAAVVANRKEENESGIENPEAPNGMEESSPEASTTNVGDSHVGTTEDTPGPREICHIDSQASPELQAGLEADSQPASERFMESDVVKQLVHNLFLALAGQQGGSSTSGGGSHSGALDDVSNGQSASQSASQPFQDSVTCQLQNQVDESFPVAPSGTASVADSLSVKAAALSLGEVRGVGTGEDRPGAGAGQQPSSLGMDAEKPSSAQAGQSVTGVPPVAWGGGKTAPLHPHRKYRSLLYGGGCSVLPALPDFSFPDVQEAAQEACVELARRATQGRDKQQSWGTKEEGPSNAHESTKDLGALMVADVATLMSNTSERSIFSKLPADRQGVMHMWTQNLRGLMELAVNLDTFTPELVGVARMGGEACWKTAAKLYAARQESAGKLLEAAVQLIAVGEAPAAVALYRRNRKIEEAADIERNWVQQAE